MALPQKVLEQLGREPPKTPGWSGQLLMFSSTIFFIALAAYLGLTYGYRPYLNSRVQKLHDNINSFAEQVPLDQQAKIISFYSQIVNLKSALTNHIYLPKLFDWLEKNTQANIYFTRLAFNATARQIMLNGVAKSMDDITQQLEIFQEQPEIKSMVFNSANLSETGWKFGVTLYFDGSFFYNRAGSVALPPSASSTPTQ